VKIASLQLDGLSEGLVTDAPPRIAFSLTSDAPGEALASARVTCGDWSVETTDQIGTVFDGEMLPWTEYQVAVHATGTSGATARAQGAFRTGRLSQPWTARWITDAGYTFPDKASPVPMLFRHEFVARAAVSRAWLEATALGIYELSLNGTKVGDQYFAPGLTSYEHQIQYQTYDVTSLLGRENDIRVTVGGGWAVGAFNYKRTSKITADRQAFLAELHIEYTDGTREVIATGPEWSVAIGGRYTMAEWYDGETFDSRVDEDALPWRPADVTRPRKSPRLIAQYGPPVREQQVMTPVSRVTSPSGETVYDFGQNFAGVIRARIDGRDGEVVVFRHAEVLVGGELFVKSLRTAKATATYVCNAGAQTYSPRLTYMGFRYVGLSGIDPERVELEAIVLHSDLAETGEFACSEPLLNQLNEAIRWGARSNFVDIPTDCPQRDERQGWTGDLAVFATTASYNFDTSRFYGKWLRDLSAEQSRGGGIPMVVPRAGDSWPVMATACWGDAAVLVPWAEYLARGDLTLLRRQYATMTRFLRAAKWWAGLFSLRPSRRLIWRFPFQFGDWAAPGLGVRDWLKRGKWMATPYFANSCGIVARIADLLGEKEDAEHYRDLQRRIVAAYRRELTDGAGTITNGFQTAYVLPLHFGMTEGDETRAMSAHLSRLIAEADGHLATGFPGTPYLLFALSDSGRVDEAYDLLMQTDCPSWLYMIVAGGTTIWERWDALRPDGTVNTDELSGAGSKESNGGMVSFNHYAAGAVGDWLYRRVAGIEPIEGGYRRFRVAPVLGGGLTSAVGRVLTPYGQAAADWSLEGDQFTLRVDVPVSTTCEIHLPDGQVVSRASGQHEFVVVLSGLN
jgi:alpha-L-rhamnosidase